MERTPPNTAIVLNRIRACQPGTTPLRLRKPLQDSQRRPGLMQVRGGDVPHGLVTRLADESRAFLEGCAPCLVPTHQSFVSEP